MLLIRHSALYFKLDVTQQWTLPGAAANTSTFCFATLTPKQQDFFHCRHSILQPPSQTYGISQSKCAQSHHSPLFARLLFLDAHHPPSALCQSLLEHNFVFCLLFTHLLEPFSTQTCETVPGDEVVCKLQAPSITNTKVLKETKVEQTSGPFLSSLPAAQLSLPSHRGSMWIPSCLTQGDNSCHPDLKVSLAIFYHETYKDFLAPMPLPFCKSWQNSASEFKNIFFFVFFFLRGLVYPLSMNIIVISLGKCQTHSNAQTTADPFLASV